MSASVNDAVKQPLPARMRGRPRGSGRFGDYRTDAELLGVSAGHLRMVLDGRRLSPSLMARYWNLRVGNTEGSMNADAGSMRK